MEKPMSGGARTERWQQVAANFIEKVWSHHKSGYGFIGARRRGSSRFHNVALSIASPVARVASVLGKYHRDEYDLYFCPNAFRSARRKAQFALPTQLAWVDIDEGEVEAFDPQPNLVWTTSPGRTQGLWVFYDERSAVDAEKYSRALAYNFASDRTGWSVTKFLRVPGTFNHKRAYRRPSVELLDEHWAPQLRKKITMGVSRRQVPPFLLVKVANPFKADPVKVLRQFRSRLHPHCRAVIQHTHCFEPDRSKRIFEIVAGLHKAGASPDEIGAVLWSSPYFIDKHGQDQLALNTELWRIIERLEEGL